MQRFAIVLSVGCVLLTGCHTTTMSKQAIKVQAEELEHGNVYHHDNHHHDHYHWGYHNHDAWGDIEVNKLCKIGQTQSPINIARVTDAKGETRLQEYYEAENFNVLNNGHTIVFNVVGNANSHITLNGTPYELLQFHYHVPSEHTVMNAHYPLELHFVHKNANDGLAVIGVLVGAGEFNAALNEVITNLPKRGTTTANLNNFNVAMLMPSEPSVYNYEGSLTTPPCTEKVEWLLKTTPIGADGNQLATLAKLYNGNNRPVQKQGTREVLLIK